MRPHQQGRILFAPKRTSSRHVPLYPSYPLPPHASRAHFPRDLKRWEAETLQQNLLPYPRLNLFTQFSLSPGHGKTFYHQRRLLLKLHRDLSQSPSPSSSDRYCSAMLRQRPASSRAGHPARSSEKQLPLAHPRGVSRYASKTALTRFLLPLSIQSFHLDRMQQYEHHQKLLMNRPMRGKDAILENQKEREHKEHSL